MIKNLFDQLDYGLFAELALALFAIIFIAIVVRTILTRRHVTECQARIVLNDKNEEQA